MFSLLKSAVSYDTAISLSLPVLFFLVFYYFKTKDKDLVFFIFADIFYIAGTVCCDNLINKINLPVDFIFYFLFYFFIFLFFRQRTKILLKYPVRTESITKTWLLVFIDFIIVAILSYIIFYYFDQPTLSSPEIHSLNSILISNFIYPILDFILLGYYININKIYITSERKVYLPLIAGISIWAISDFLYAYEKLFKGSDYEIGDCTQILGLIILVTVLIIIKISKIDSYYTTIDVYRDNSKLSNYNLLINSIVVLYIFIYIYCLTNFNDSLYFMNVANKAGIAMLTLAIIRYNIINYDMQHKLNKLSKDASTDPLTGLFSRKYAFTLINSLYKSSLYFNIDISVLMLDIDHFKAYNDTYGHVNGDYVLKDIAMLITGSIESSNIICRYGGEEFLIVLPGVDSIKGLQIAEEIRTCIEKYDFHQKEPHTSGKITVSIGGATADSNTRDVINLVEQADAALYRAKKERNKTSWFYRDLKIPQKSMQ